MMIHEGRLKAGPDVRICTEDVEAGFAGSLGNIPGGRHDNVSDCDGAQMRPASVGAPRLVGCRWSQMTGTGFQGDAAVRAVASPPAGKKYAPGVAQIAVNRRRRSRRRRLKEAQNRARKGRAPPHRCRGGRLSLS